MGNMRRTISGLKFLPAWLILELIAFYQALISPAMVGNCRFYPTCSAYATEAIQRHGIFRGLMLAIRRVLRCNPWGSFGEDPVPVPETGRGCRCGALNQKQTNET